MENNSYTYSQLSAGSLAAMLVSHYGLPANLDCRFYVVGLHDNYLIQTRHQKYICRIYRNDWREPDAILFELQLLAFLAERKAPVAVPLATRSGQLTFQIDSPEGPRLAALFHYADGQAPAQNFNIEHSELLGNAIAGIHRKSNAFTTTFIRPELDLPYLLDESIIRITPFLNATSLRYLESLQLKIHQRLPCLSREPDTFGICTGDVNARNFHINDSRQLTLFDFDQCGFGYRAFEIGKFISSLHSMEQKRELTQAFMDGYQQIRQLDQEEIEAIPWYEMVAAIWVMAIHANNADRIGYKLLEPPFWERRMAILKTLDTE